MYLPAIAWGTLNNNICIVNSNLVIISIIDITISGIIVRTIVVITIIIVVVIIIPNSSGTGSRGDAKDVTDK